MSSRFSFFSFPLPLHPEKKEKSFLLFTAVRAHYSGPSHASVELMGIIHNEGRKVEWGLLDIYCRSSRLLLRHSIQFFSFLFYRSGLFGFRFPGGKISLVLGSQGRLSSWQKTFLTVWLQCPQDINLCSLIGFDFNNVVSGGALSFYSPGHGRWGHWSLEKYLLDKKGPAKGLRAKKGEESAIKASLALKWRQIPPLWLGLGERWDVTKAESKLLSW